MKPTSILIALATLLAMSGSARAADERESLIDFVKASMKAWNDCDVDKQQNMNAVRQIASFLA